MSEKKISVVHSTFSVERTYPVPPSRVFAAFADPQAKQRWFSGSHDFEVLEFSADFRVGGHERGRFRFAMGELRNETVYQNIVPDRRIVFAQTMCHGETPIVSALGTVELIPEGNGTRLVYTDQNALFDGAEAFLAEGSPGSRVEGWKAILKALDEELRSVAR